MKTIADLVDGFRQWDKTAVIYKSGIRTFKLTYAELHSKILQTAAFMEKQGLKKGDNLILWGMNSQEWGIVYLAAAIKGIVVIPVDFLAVAEFVGKIQEQVKAKAIFHSEFKVPPHLEIKDYVLEHLDHHIENMKPTQPDASLRASDLLALPVTLREYLLRMAI